MPELPDVETFKRYVDSTALHQRIEGVTVRNRRILRTLSPQRLARSLIGRRFQRTSRHGNSCSLTSGKGDARRERADLGRLRAGRVCWCFTSA